MEPLTTHHPDRSERLRLAAAGLLLLATFIVLAVLNSGGYRYGASDQAYYVPAVMRRLDPALFPRDRPILGTQDHLLLIDDGLALIVATSLASLESVFGGAYLVMLAAVAAAGWTLGRALFATRWAAAALVLAMSIRHRVPKTGVNTLEHYFHPRMLAFAVGVLALAALLQRRRLLALALALGTGALHPTTGLWFSATVAGGLALTDRTARRWLLGLGAPALVLAAVWVARGGLEARLVVMDADWLAILASKDYLFPTDWAASTWLLHLLYVVVVGGTWAARRARGVLAPGETTLVAGLAVLLALVLVALPWVHLRLALAVQLQVSRAMWLFDILAVAYAVWWLVEARRPGAAGPGAGRWAVTLVAAIALARGSYVMFVERAGHPVWRIGLADDAWRDVMRWVGRQPVGTYVLADPGHAWRHGSSVRIAAGRDVFLEEVKDAAMATYSREVAIGVLARTRALGDFASLTSAQARTLSDQFGVDVLVTDRALDLPVAYDNGRFRVYLLRGP